MVTTPQNLFAIRSRVIEELLGYLDDVARKAAEVPPFYPSHLRTVERGGDGFEQIHQTVRIVRDRREFDRRRAEEAERLHRAGISPERTAYSRPIEHPEGRTQERVREAQPVVVWNESTAESPDFRRAIILGDPGFGKSWLLRHEAWRLAVKARRHLHDRNLPLQEVTLPICLRLSDLRRTSGPIRDAIVKLVCGPSHSARKHCQRDVNHSARFRDFVIERLGSSQTVLLLDAWDEVTSGRSELLRRLMEFAARYPEQRILLTSRLVGYGIAPIPGAREAVLQPFGTVETEAFVRQWFRGEPGRNDA